MKLEELTPNTRVSGVIPTTSVQILGVQRHGADAVELTYRTTNGLLGQRILTRSDEAGLVAADVGGRPFTADAADFKLAAEALRIKHSGLFDLMPAVATSKVQPLPHQIRAVYGELLPRTPLRFLLADDPGAGKTIMAGLYIKELLLRDDVQRCLVVAPGGLVEQWQDELFFKFGLRFAILTGQQAEMSPAETVFDTYPLLIARMDQLARNEKLLAQLDRSEWDLVIVDEAHRMSAQYFNGRCDKTKRFQLGERLGRLTRHLLLMTATPHAGKEEDFQLFLTLLDRDRFEGEFDEGVHSRDTTDIMRRMVKEDLLTFEGRPLFPERVASTVPYELTQQEQALYDDVTTYVREGMNRAQRLDGQRRNTVGFALTVLQRRLASSPEAIYRSLLRRSQRLERQRHLILSGAVVEPQPCIDLADFDDAECSADEVEQMESELVDAATAAGTVEELTAELMDLQRLAAAAERVRDSGTDKKWVELRAILEHDAGIVSTPAEGHPRKLIIFTEHRDTLDYLTRRIRMLLGKPAAVQAIHGGVDRAERRRITEEFTRNPDCQVLLATDAAGEGLNLQVAHLMVNYDLPWNPNRIEQRFGRIHRIGQTEVCQLWNLVASTTREGEVFTRLLDKIEEQRAAYGGKVFDVLGKAFDEQPLRDLLIDAIQYGDQPEVRARMHQVIDASISDGLAELLDERALAHDRLGEHDLAALRLQMDEARVRRLQPHYIEGAFRTGLKRLGGRIVRRERGRFEITHVPAAVPGAANGPVATRYERVTFDLGETLQPSGTPAELLAPGQPLHDAVTDLVIAICRGSLDHGTVLVSSELIEPHLLLGILQEVVDGTETPVARKFGYAFVASNGSVHPAGPAPHLDCVAAPAGPVVDRARALPWLSDAEQKAISYIITEELASYVEEVRPRRIAELARTRAEVSARLTAEMNRLAADAEVAAQHEAASRQTRDSAESLGRRAEELRVRLNARLTELDRQAHLSTKPPRVVSAALVLPVSWVDGDGLSRSVQGPTGQGQAVQRRGVEAVLAAERALGRIPSQESSNPWFDVLSHDAGGDPIRIQTKCRILGGDEVHVSHNQVLAGMNAAPGYRLALVNVHPDGPHLDEVRYLDQPFATLDLGDVNIAAVRLDWSKVWPKGKPPF